MFHVEHVAKGVIAARLDISPTQGSGLRHGRRMEGLPALGVRRDHQLKEQYRAGAADWEVTELVDDEQRRVGQDLRRAWKRPAALGLLEGGEQVKSRANVLERVCRLPISSNLSSRVT